MADVYEDTGTNQEYASKMPAINNDADIRLALQAYHYGDPSLATTANSADFSGTFDDPDGGIVAKLKYLKTEIAGLSLGGIPNSIVNAKGDLIGATANDTPARLAVGTNGYILKANSATASGLEWYDASTTHLSLSGGTLVGDVSMLKASPTFTLEASSGNGIYEVEGVSGSAKGLLFKTGASNRWYLRSNSTAESSTATGSDLQLTAYDNSGVSIGDPISITRSSLLVTLSSLSVSGTSSLSSLSVSGTSSLTGAVTASSTITASTAPSSGGHLTNKTYVDAQDALKLNLSGGTLTGALYVNNSTASTSESTGALRTAGGLGVAGSIYAGSTINTVDGNMNVNKTASNAVLNLNSPSGSYATAVYYNRGGYNRWTSGHSTTLDFHIGRYDSSGNFLNSPLVIEPTDSASTGITRFQDTGDATSSSTGSVRFSGGVGIAKKLYVGTEITAADITATTSLTVPTIVAINILLGGSVWSNLPRSVQTGHYTPNTSVFSGYTFEFTNSSDANFNIPTDGAQNFDIGWWCRIFKVSGAGNVNVVTSSGVTLRNQYKDANSDFAMGSSAGASVVIWKRAANDWCLAGLVGIEF